MHESVTFLDLPGHIDGELSVRIFRAQSLVEIFINDVAADGDRLLRIRVGGTGLGSSIRGTFVYVQNWLEELKELVGN